MKQQCFEVTNTTKEDYLQFCKSMGINYSAPSSKKLFFSYLLDNKIVKDSKTGAIIIKGEK